jgi:hypothetical protein
MAEGGVLIQLAKGDIHAIAGGANRSARRRNAIDELRAIAEATPNPG